ncbi:uncharacterized protein LOC141854188 isoform X2 [Brevipalpus obovatus]|uniref:uncharacterized protein LOC141854188 isoform X2 n=1 Tax=Brevipalpus obovatus TaxID=246614 RepID=UPI003D9E836B
MKMFTFSSFITIFFLTSLTLLMSMDWTTAFVVQRSGRDVPSSSSTQSVQATVKLMTQPFGVLADAMSQGLLTLSIAAYMMGHMAPKLAGGIRSMEAPIIARLVDPAIDEHIPTIADGVDSISEAKTVLDSLLSNLGIDSVECKELVAFRAGQVMQEKLGNRLSEILSATAGTVTDDAFAKVILDSMAGAMGAEPNHTCEGLNGINKYWQELKTKGPIDVAKEAVKSTLLKALESITSLEGDKSGGNLAPGTDIGAGQASPNAVAPSSPTGLGNEVAPAVIISQ